MDRYTGHQSKARNTGKWFLPVWRTIKPSRKVYCCTQISNLAILMASNAVEIFYHASHEQFPPSELLQLAKMAELAGFDGVHSSDHFHPWSERQGQSGFSFSWIAAAMQATHLPFSMVCAPGQRYHPAIVAQAIATLAEMFPGRFSVELGSGEALNESITGDVWPQKEERNARL